MLPLVAIVGRPNVGKSTLFNRVVGGRAAIAHDEPGVTRDRRYAEGEWAGRRFRVCDTGGLDPGGAGISALVHRQARQAVDEADVVVFVLDALEGITPADREVADLLRRQGPRAVLYAANKVDSDRREAFVGEVYALGAAEVHGISASHGRGVGDLLDAVVALLPPAEPGAEAEEGTGPLRLAFVGRPNVGKSSLVNRLLGAERVLVHDQPGTTRDPVDTPFEYRGRRFVLCDTAGMRRRARVDESVEQVAALLAERAAVRADVCAVVIDGAEGPTEQDARLCDLIERAGRGAVLVLSKSDRWRAGDDRRLRREVREQLGFVSWAEVVVTSARTGEGVTKIIDAAARAWEAHGRRVPTSELNRVFEGIVERHPPPGIKGQPVRLYYATQAQARPPSFVITASRPDAITASYRRYLMHEIRKAFDFTGTPVRLRFHGRGKSRRSRA
ncbi:MAG: ribosome biogenesis GTPase Der [Deltaproteobacteria bacterium]|nr:ribosome biogenesis GTPase Der [Deltaproteobacteria bacterium]